MTKSSCNIDSKMGMGNLVEYWPGRCTTFEWSFRPPPTHPCWKLWWVPHKCRVGPLVWMGLAHSHCFHLPPDYPVWSLWPGKNKSHRHPNSHGWWSAGRERFHLKRKETMPEKIYRHIAWLLHTTMNANLVSKGFGTAMRTSLIDDWTKNY